MIENLHYVKDLGKRSREALEAARPATFGELMHEHWEHKKRSLDGHEQPEDRRVVRDRPQGTARIGGKLVGAGGGGFLMFYAEDNRGCAPR